MDIVKGNIVKIKGRLILVHSCYNYAKKTFNHATKQVEFGPDCWYIEGFDITEAEPVYYKQDEDGGSVELISDV